MAQVAVEITPNENDDNDDNVSVSIKLALQQQQQQQQASQSESKYDNIQSNVKQNKTKMIAKTIFEKKPNSNVEAPDDHDEDDTKSIMNDIKNMKSNIMDAVEDLVDDIPKAQREALPRCCTYFAFVIIYSVMAILSRSLSSEIFYQTSIVTELVTGGSISDSQDSAFYVNSLVDMWDYIHDVLLPAVLVETDINGDFIQAESKRYYIGEQIRVMGGIRLRMFKLEQQTCTYGSRKDVDSKPATFLCAFDSENEETDDIELKDGTVVQHTSAEKLRFKDIAFNGILEVYPASGYIVDLPLNLTKSQDMITNLKASTNFMSRASRALIVDFNGFNPNTGIHTVARLVYENAKTGGIVPTFQIKSWRFLKYDFNTGIALIITTIAFFVGVCIITYDLARHIARAKGLKGYLKKDSWHYVDLTNVLFFWTTIVIKIIELIHRGSVDFINIEEFESLQFSAFLIEVEMYMSMVNGFLVWIKMFKYLSFSKRLTFLFLMMRRSSTDFIVFGFVILVFVCAFGMSGFLVFSPDVRDFRTVQHAFANLIRYIVSDMNFDELAHSNTLVGSLFYTIWTILMLLILSNVFIAILSNSYDAISDQFDQSEGIKAIFGYQKLVADVANKMKRPSATQAFRRASLAPFRFATMAKKRNAISPNGTNLNHTSVMKQRDIIEDDGENNEPIVIHNDFEDEVKNEDEQQSNQTTL